MPVVSTRVVSDTPPSRAKQETIPDTRAYFGLSSNVPRSPESQNCSAGHLKVLRNSSPNELSVSRRSPLLVGSESVAYPHGRSRESNYEESSEPAPCERYTMVEVSMMGDTQLSVPENNAAQSVSMFMEDSHFASANCVAFIVLLRPNWITLTMTEWTGSKCETRNRSETAMARQCGTERQARTLYASPPLRCEPPPMNSTSIMTSAILAANVGLSTRQGIGYLCTPVIGSRPAPCAV